uniref:Uncharacterized protein n=1 Tax=Vespula pensylvanica TaxID=30213 RepID=A0A834KU24_VESPE|nr:hypothetical protein H0235_012719 [Vespula pensylvanica]
MGILKRRWSIGNEPNYAARKLADRKESLVRDTKLEPPQTPVHVDGYCIKTVQEEEEEKEEKKEEEEEEEEKEELLANSNRFRISENLQWNVLEMVYSEQYLFGTTRHHGDDDEDDDDEDDDYLSLENWRTIDCPRRQQQIDMSNLPTKGLNHHHESSMVETHYRCLWRFNTCRDIEINIENVSPRIYHRIYDKQMDRESVDFRKSPLHLKSCKDFFDDIYYITRVKLCNE